MSRIRNTKISLWFGYATFVLNFAQGIILIPLYLKFVSLETYGFWLATGNVVVWMTIVDPGFGVVIQQAVAQAFGGRDFEKIRGWTNTAYSMGSVGAALVILVGLSLSSFLPRILHMPSGPISVEIVSAFRLSVLSAGFMILVFNVGSVLIGLQSALFSGIASFGMNLVWVFLVIGGLWYGLGVVAIAGASLIRAAVWLLLGMWYLRVKARQEGFHIEPRFALQAGSFALLGFTSLGSGMTSLAANVDSFILTRIVGPETAAIVALTRKPIFMGESFLHRNIQAIMPALSHVYGARDLERTSQVARLCLFLVAWCVLPTVFGFAALNGAFIVLWIGGQNYAGVTINLMLCLLTVLSLIAGIGSNFSWALGNIRGNSVANSIQAIVTMTAAFGFALAWGAKGLIGGYIVGQLAVGSWYYGHYVGGRLNWGVGVLRDFLRESAVAGLASLGGWAAASLVLRPGIFSFVLSFLVFCLVTILGMLGLSSRFRGFVTVFLRERSLKELLRGV